MRSLVSKRLALIVMRVAPSSSSWTASRSSAYSPLRSNHVTMRPCSSRAFSSSASREASIPLTSKSFPHSSSQHHRLRRKPPSPRKRITCVLEGKKTNLQLHQTRSQRTCHSTYQHQQSKWTLNGIALDHAATSKAMG